MCSALRVLLSSILLFTSFSANGLITHGGKSSILIKNLKHENLNSHQEQLIGFLAVFKTNTAGKTRLYIQDNYIQNPYKRFFRNDLEEVGGSLKRIDYLEKNADQKFRFEKPSYNVTTTTEIIGLLTALKLVTALKNTVQYGLLTDDAYVSQVFRIGPTTGLLYSDTKLKRGVYYFEVTADIIDLQLHATANVTVNVTLPTPKKSLNIELYSLLAPVKKLLLSNLEGTKDEVTSSQPSWRPQTTSKYKRIIDNLPVLPLEVSRDVYKGDLQTPYGDLWRGTILQLITWQNNDKKTSTKDLLKEASNPRPRIELIVPHEHSRYQRAISPRIYATSDFDERTSPVSNDLDVATVASIKVRESALADDVMSSFVLFVSTFASVILVVSLVYFIYKRLKKCGDYSVDDDIKYMDRPLENDVIMKNDLKSSKFLCVNEIHQNRVTDSIVITKAKLQGQHLPSVFTIQKCYEAHQAQSAAGDGDHRDDDDDLFIVDMSEMSTNSQEDVYNTITLQSYTHSTPAITATLIGAPPPVSILSSSRRSSVVSCKQSDGSDEMGPNGDTRRKSVTFSDIVELYQIKAN